MALNHTVLLRHKPGHLCLILVSRSETQYVRMCEMLPCHLSCIRAAQSSERVSSATVTKVSDAHVKNPCSKLLGDVRFLVSIFSPLFNTLC